jgi:MFS family permease
MSSAGSLHGRRAGLPFILVVVFIDVLGIGIAIPVLPMLVGEYTASRELQAYWYGALVVVYGIMQFFCAPLLGALSDRFGRRPVLLWSLLGPGCTFFARTCAFADACVRCPGDLRRRRREFFRRQRVRVRCLNRRAAGEELCMIGAAFGSASSSVRCSAVACSAA